MATKKSSRKKKNSTSRRNVFLAVLIAVITVVIAFFSVYLSQESVKDEKFLAIRETVWGVKQALETSGNQDTWIIENWCDPGGNAFATPQERACGTSVRIRKADQTVYTDLRTGIEKKGFRESSEDTDEYGNHFVYFSKADSDIRCVVSLIPDVDPNVYLRGTKLSCSADTIGGIKGYESPR